ncbi:MAG: hypothetical protein JXQ29_15620 [Planctomycetes bacterium]|nr:hypothetical protein [Planctomycetota bacterium]
MSLSSLRGTRCLARMFALLLVGLAAAPLARAQDVERTMRVHDCEFLVARKPDLPGPDLTPFLLHPEQLVVAMEEEFAAGALEPDRLVDMIRANIYPDSWHHEKNAIKVERGKLVVVQTPEVQDEIATLLERLRRSRMRMVHLTGWVVSVRADHFAAWHTETLGSGRASAVISPESLQRLLDVKPGDDRMRVLATLSLPADSNQLVHAGPVRRTRVIQDLDVSIAQAASTSQPAVTDCLTGSVLQFRPALVGDDLVLLNASLAHAVRHGEMKTLETGVGRIDLPVRSLQSAATTLLIPKGHAALVAVSDAVNEGRRIVFLVEPEVVGEALPAEEGKAEATPGSTPRELRVYNTRLLTASIPDWPCPFVEPGLFTGIEINLDAADEESGASIFGRAPPETPPGVGLDPAELIELIRTGIAEDSWSNTRNRIETSGDLLIVVQTPEVHAAIARFLSELRARRGVLVTTEVWALGVRTDEVARLFPRPADLRVPLAPEAIERVHQAVADGSARVLRHVELTSFNRQRAHAVSILERSVIDGVDAEVAQKASIGDPIVGTLRSGFLVDARASLVGDGKTLGLDLLAAFVATSEPRVVAYREGEPYVVHEYDAEAANLATNVLLPDGGAMAFLRGTVPGRPDLELVYLVNARTTRVSGKTD